MLRYGSILIGILLLMVSAHGAEIPQQTDAYRASVEQEQLRVQAKRLLADMKRMLEEFRGNPAAAEEVALTKLTIEKLEALSESEMASVVLALREASSAANSGDAASKILSANKTAKEIQGSLTRLADRLALYQDEASLELRLVKLIRRQAANQRQTKYMSKGVLQGDVQTKEAELAEAEQKAIKSEIDSLLETLQRLAGSSENGRSSVFSSASNAASDAQLADVTGSALTLLGAKDFPNATVAEGRVIEGLQAMLLALGSGKSLEERLRALEEQMRSLAAKENLLSRSTVKSSIEQQRVVLRKQREIADQRTVVEREVTQLNPDTALVLIEVRATMESLDEGLLRDGKLMANPNKKLEVVSAQNEVSAKFLQIAEMLKKQGDAVAEASAAGSDANSAQDALAGAASSVMDALARMEMSREMLNQGGDANAANEQISKAQESLANAQNQLGNAQGALPQGPGESLAKSRDSLGNGQQQASQGGNQSRTEASSSVGKAEEFARQALAGMQQAMDGMGGLGQAGQLTGNNEEGSGSGGGAGWGTVRSEAHLFTAFSALAKISEEDRRALSVVKDERPPPEYSIMTQQYMKNLAEGAVSGQ